MQQSKMVEFSIPDTIRSRVSRPATLVFQRPYFGLLRRLLDSSLAGSPEGQRSPARLDILCKGNI